MSSKFVPAQTETFLEERREITGRGASSQLANRFEKFHFTPEMQEWDAYLEEERPSLRTQFYRDFSRTIVNENASPDIGFNSSINAYRGCEHGCAYCYARPTHEFLGMSPGLDFETKIFVKENAPELLRAHLMKKSWEPQTIGMSGVTDCYQPIERKLKITRGCLEVLAKFKNPVAIITKNALVTRDIDLLKELAHVNAALVFLSVTTLDADLCGKLEPRTSRPQARLRAIQELSEAGIPVGVNVAPVIPGLTDHELPAILKAASEHGAQFAGFTPLRLPLAVSPIFQEWLEQHRPENKDRVLGAVRDIRGGKLNDSRFGTRMQGEGARAENIEQLFRLFTKKFGLNKTRINLSSQSFSRPGDQMALF